MAAQETTTPKTASFESICSEFNQNKLMKKYQGYAQNEKFKVGLNGKTVYIFDNDENELARFQDAPYMYRGKFIPNTNTLVVKSTAGWLLFYDLDSLALIKKIRFSNIGSQDWRILQSHKTANIYITLKHLTIQPEPN